jgi:hypothetical protein
VLCTITKEFDDRGRFWQVGTLLATFGLQTHADPRPAFSRILVLIIGLVRPPQELRSYRELTAAEFDALQASAPAIRDGCLRQLRAAMGDTRGGRELLEEWEADRWR